MGLIFTLLSANEKLNEEESQSLGQYLGNDGCNTGALCRLMEGFSETISPCPVPI